LSESWKGDFAGLMLLVMIGEHEGMSCLKWVRSKKVYVLKLGRSERESNDRGGVIACCWRFQVGLGENLD